MAKYFEARTSAPSTDNKFYLKAGKGGYNLAMEINSSTHSCLPNCCGLAHGRWLESQEQTDYDRYDNLCLGNAGSYWGKDDGYERGQTPRLGAVMCWSKDGGAGHVAFVEEIYSNGDVLSSNSAYNGTRFYTKKLTKSSNYNFGSKYHFQGFIYPPVEFTDDLIIQPVPRDENKFQLKVLTDGVEVKFYSANDGETRGYVKKDCIYDVKGTAKNGGDWYQIDDIQWIYNKNNLEIYPLSSGDVEELKRELVEEQEKSQKLEDLNKSLNEENDKLNQEIDKFNKIYTCDKTDYYKFKIKMYENESLYIK